MRKPTWRKVYRWPHEWEPPKISMLAPLPPPEHSVTKMIELMTVEVTYGGLITEIKRERVTLE